MTKQREAKAAMWLQKVILRGIEGIISDKYLEIVVTQEWRNVADADNAFLSNFESKYMAEQIYAQLQGNGL